MEEIIKMKRVFLLFVVSCIIIASGFVIYSGDLDVDLISGINEQGQTYGTEGSDKPDLIAAEGIDGTLGYVLRSDAEPPEFKTPEEALEWQEKNKDRKAIPLYDSDGITVIGEFEMWGYSYGW